MLESQKYTIDQNTDKNKGDVDFKYKVENYGANKYRIKITPVNVGDVKDGIVKYKKSNVDYWTAAKDNQIIVNQVTVYDIIYIDANNNSKQKQIKLSVDYNGKVSATEVTK